jgi:hypothetical protein
MLLSLITCCYFTIVSSHFRWLSAELAHSIKL